MNRRENERHVKKTYFDQAMVRLTRLAGRLVEDADAVVAEASSIFDDMLPTMAYVDKPAHPLAPALFICNVNLSLYLALKRRGIDVHDFGRSLLIGLTRAPIPAPQEMSEAELQESFAQFAAAAADSQRNPGQGEDVFEIVPAENADFDWGYDVTSCSVRHSASIHDATELVPYLCAVDDVMSDKGNQGLRRTGSLAVGANRCDFRYRRGGTPLPLAAQYPALIQITKE